MQSSPSDRNASFGSDHSPGIAGSQSNDGGASCPGSGQSRSIWPHPAARNGLADDGHEMRVLVPPVTQIPAAGMAEADFIGYPYPRSTLTTSGAANNCPRCFTRVSSASGKSPTCDEAPPPRHPVRIYT
jgi:hypothetical protein